MAAAEPLVVELAALSAADLPRAGGKAVALGRLARAGLPVPAGVCVTTAAYRRYLDATGLQPRLALLLERKPFAQMRWEELWDLGLRVRNLFLTTPLPAVLRAELSVALAPLACGPAVVRSSAPAEDSAAASFAGLHDSFVNVCGLEALLDRLKLVWASLWSDRALLYRQELALDPAHSAMAAVIGELVSGDRSGVAFSHCPGRTGLAVIEAVWGLNQGLVDGDVPPDRLLIDRRSKAIVSREAPERVRACRATAEGVTLQPLPQAQRDATPLDDQAATAVLDLLYRAEELFGGPQDLEWTMRGARPVALQARPITTAAPAAGGGERAWYLSLHRSLAALKQLKVVIEEQLLPALAAAADRLEGVDLAELSDEELAAAISERQDALADGEERYRESCIPMAHGIRLFGEVYNDRLRPADPFAFLDLLAGDRGLLAVKRNAALVDLAARLRDDPALAARLHDCGELPADSPFAGALAAFKERFGDLGRVLGGGSDGERGLLTLLLELAAAPPRGRCQPVDEAAFFAAFTPVEQDYARELLEIGRASYRLRDNDNLALGRLSGCLQAAHAEGARRRAKRSCPLLDELAPPEEGVPPPGIRLQARQLVGQPAGPGLSQGRARVIHRPQDLATLQAGEILVCDAIDPNMTFVVPLAAGIVERRGGMLIHGAIIAREYGLPCVTGVPEATRLISDGDWLTVDGYLGLVVIATGERGGRA